MSATLPSFDPHPLCQGCSADNDHEDSLDANALDRRSVLSKGVLAAVAAALTAGCATSGASANAGANAGAAASTANTPALGMWMLRIRVKDFPELESVGGIARVDGTSDKPVALVRTDAGYSAFSLRCPHAGVTVGSKDGHFVCPGHGAEFNPDGTWLTGHRARNLKSLTVTFDARAGVATIMG